MCNPVLVGMAIGAGMSAMQGGGIKEIALGAVIGGASAGFAAPAGQAFVGFSSATGAATAGIFAGPGISGSIFAEGVTSAITSGFLGGGLAGMFAQPDYSQFGYGAQPYEPQGYSYQQPTVTGSGGRQAAAFLAEEIKRSRTLRQRQQEETTAYNVAGELASTGLQIA